MCAGSRLFGGTWITEPSNRRTVELPNASRVGDVGLPKIKGASGGPARILAVW